MQINSYLSISIRSKFILIIMLIGADFLTKSCKQDIHNNGDLAIKVINKPLNSVYDCDGVGSMVCDTVIGCNYNPTCCSTRQDLIRSNYSSSTSYAIALARELEKVMNGCTPQVVHEGCTTDKFCWAFNSATFGGINNYFGASTNPFAFCTFATTTSPYTCGGIQYNVDIPIALQNIMVSVIRMQFLDPNGTTCPEGDTRSLVETRFRICSDPSINCVEYPDCFNMFLTAEFTVACCHGISSYK
ncbi:MAG: hypothetical protein ABI851_11870 [Saprospiraceae bacterium]